MPDFPEIFLIAGPTASGKSALALQLAQQSGGAIINCDSMQVYDTLDVLTARPNASALQQAEHLLYGTVQANQAWSVARWLADARSVAKRLQEAGRPAIFTGGTGLYFKALTQGLSSMPAADPLVRAHWRAVADSEPQRLHGELMARDANAATRLQKGDRQRLVRALEIFDTTGRSILEFQQAVGEPVVSDASKAVFIVVERDRPTLHARINQRFDEMLKAGALDEVKALLALDLPHWLPVKKAIGVAQLERYLAGLCSLAEAGEAAKTATRQYAKRQSTWFRNQLGPKWQRTGSPDTEILTFC